jgi:hypothetical protein
MKGIFKTYREAVNYSLECCVEGYNTEIVSYDDGSYNVLVG